MSAHPFSSLGLDIGEALAARLSADGIVTPTEIQSLAIPVVLSGRDAIVQSGTGTGKTLAYVLPLLQRIGREPALRVVIAAPSPELAMQILRVVETYKDPTVTTASLIGGGNPDRQKDKLKKHPRIVVGTPGRLLDMILAKKLKTADIGVLVLDETDEILSPGNEKQLREIASRPEFKPQVIFTSATFRERSAKLTEGLMDPEPVHLVANTAPTPSTVAHHFIIFEAQRREVSLIKLLSRHDMERALVFVNTLHNVAHLHRFLNDRNVATVSLSSERSKEQRRNSITAFQNGKARVLVATDTAARGLDVPGLDWVIHYEPARDVEHYVHRIGRTGRAGRPGTSVTMVAPKEMFLLKRYSEALGIEFTPLRLDDGSR